MPLPSIEQTKKFEQEAQIKPNANLWNFKLKDVAEEHKFKKPKVLTKVKSDFEKKTDKLLFEKSLRDKFKMRIQYKEKGVADVLFP